MQTWALRAVGALLILSALAMALLREPDRPVESLVARWAPPPSDFVLVDGQVTHVRDEGPRDDPLPVVLVHGTSASLHTWEGWVKAIKTRRRVITLDLPGFGLTGPSTAGDYRGDTYARFVLDLMDALRVRRFVVGGNSLGGDVAWRVAAFAPGRVERLILVDAAGLPFDAPSLPLGWRIARTPGLGWLIEGTLPRALVAQGVATAYADPSRITDALVDRYFELTLREGNRSALIQRVRLPADLSGVQRVPSLRLPTLILWGARDAIIPLDVGRRFAQAIPGSRLVVFDDLGHVPHEEDPARTVQPVLQFLGLK